MKKSLFAFLLTILTAVSLFADYPKPGDADFFPIMGWDVGGEFQGTFTLEFFQEMRKAGFNIAGIFSPGEPGTKLIDQVDGLYFWGYMGNAHALTDNKKGTPEEYAAAVAKDIENGKQNPHLYGHFITDEPNADAFRYFSQVCQELNRQVPEAQWYLNLFPTICSPETLKTATYEEYVERFINECEPHWVGYDNYTLMDDGTIRADHWYQIRIIRDITLAHGIPFQACVLATGHLNYRAPSEADLFFEVYSALLYGAKGIQYFNYWPPARASYHGGPVDQLGNKTPTWYAIKAVNESVHNLAPVLNRLQSTKVYHFQPWKPMKDENPPKSDSLVKGFDNKNLAIAVGEFVDTTNGDIYVMLLNKDLHRSANVNGIQWRKQPKNIEVCSPFKKGAFLPEKFFSENAFIIPGRALLLKLEF